MTIVKLNTDSIHTLGRQLTMQHSSTAAIRIAAFRRRAAALAVASALATAGTAHAFEITTGNPDLTLRWDNTLRLNAGVRVQSQDEALLKNPNLDDGNRNFRQRVAGHRAHRRAFRVRPRLAAQLRLPRERRAAGGILPTAASTTRTRRPRIRWSTAFRSPGSSATSPSAMPKGRRASGSTPSPSATSTWPGFRST